MGIDVHTLNFLRYEHERGGDFGSSITLGRQSLHVNPRQIEAAFPSTDGRSFGSTAEQLLMAELGATRVDSLDNSDFEEASIIRDLNVHFDRPPDPYDVVLDLGTLEHIYDIATALWNVSSLASVDGRILHVLPANQFCGHGFWQLAPELFFSLYAQDRGYAGTEVFVAEIPRERWWWSVHRPRPGERVSLHGRMPMYVMCRTTKVRDDVDHSDIQQSDYSYAWQQDRRIGEPGRWKGRLLSTPLAPLLWYLGRRDREIRFRYRSGVNGRNPDLTRVMVDDLCSPAR